MRLTKEEVGGADGARRMSHPEGWVCVSCGGPHFSIPLQLTDTNGKEGQSSLQYTILGLTG